MAGKAISYATLSDEARVFWQHVVPVELWFLHVTAEAELLRAGKIRGCVTSGRFDKLGPVRGDMTPGATVNIVADT